LLERYLIFYFSASAIKYLHQNKALKENCFLLVRKMKFAPQLFNIGIIVHCSETPASQ